MIDPTSRLQVSRNDAIGGGIRAAISAMRSSAIGPGPLGIADTSPSAEAPCRTASSASEMLAMQQTLMRVVLKVCGPLVRRTDVRRQRAPRAQHRPRASLWLAPQQGI